MAEDITIKSLFNEVGSVIKDLYFLVDSQTPFSKFIHTPIDIVVNLSYYVIPIHFHPMSDHAYNGIRYQGSWPEFCSPHH